MHIKNNFSSKVSPLPNNLSDLPFIIEAPIWALYDSLSVEAISLYKGELVVIIRWKTPKMLEN